MILVQLCVHICVFGKSELGISKWFHETRMLGMTNSGKLVNVLYVMIMNCYCVSIKNIKKLEFRPPDNRFEPLEMSRPMPSIPIQVSLESRKCSFIFYFHPLFIFYLSYFFQCIFYPCYRKLFSLLIPMHIL